MFLLIKYFYRYDDKEKTIRNEWTLCQIAIHGCQMDEKCHFIR